MLLLRSLAYLEQQTDTCLYARYQRKMLAINSVFDFESETAGVTLESSMGVAEFCLFSGLCNCKISAHLSSIKFV